MRMRTGELMAVAMTMLATLVTAPVTSSAQGSATATLSVLAPPVDRVAVGSAAAAPGADGMNLAEGDRVKTGAGGLALITFLDGSTVTVLPQSDVTVKQNGGDRSKAGIRMLINAGRVWARVVQAAGRRAPLSLESNEYAATAHDGLIGAENTGDGFVCWSRRGEVRLTDRSGQTDVVVMAGRRAKARFGMPAVPEPFVPSASVLEVRTTGPVVPMVKMPDGQVAAGFLAPDVEINQVFGSLTSGDGKRWLVEVPGGIEGPYTVVLTGTDEGAFTMKVSGRFAGMAVYHQEMKGEARRGERLATRVTHDVSGNDPKTARLIEASFEALRPWDGAPTVIAEPALPRRDRVN